MVYRILADLPQARASQGSEIRNVHSMPIAIMACADASTYRLGILSVKMPAMKMPARTAIAMTVRATAARPASRPLLANKDTWWNTSAVLISDCDDPANNSSHVLLSLAKLADLRLGQVHHMLKTVQQRRSARGSRCHDDK